jgi:uncharacterized protein (TIGR02444 family)
MTESHWQFSLAVYGKPGVSASCLLLQERCGVDINVLLICLYATVGLRLAVGDDVVGQLDGTIHDIRSKVVEPLRAIRRDMKGAAYGPATERVRNQVKSAELAAEQLEQAALAAALEGRSADAGAPLDTRDVAGAVVHYFSGLVRVPTKGDAEVEQAMRIIAAAAAEEGRPADAE